MCRNIIFLLATVMCFFSSSLEAQTNRTIEIIHIGDYNYVDTYNEDIQSIALILNSTNSSEINQACSELKNMYHQMSGSAITDVELEILLDANQSNYDTWMGVLEHASNFGSGYDLFVLNSIIINIRKKL